MPLVGGLAVLKHRAEQGLNGVLISLTLFNWLVGLQPAGPSVQQL